MTLRQPIRPVILLMAICRKPRKCRVQTMCQVECMYRDIDVQRLMKVLTAACETEKNVPSDGYGRSELEEEGSRESEHSRVNHSNAHLFHVTQCPHFSRLCFLPRSILSPRLNFHPDLAIICPDRPLQAPTL